MTPALISTSSSGRGAASGAAPKVAPRAAAATRAAAVEPALDEDTTTTTTTTTTTATTTSSSQQHASAHLQKQPRGGDGSSTPHCSPRTKPGGHHLHAQDKQQLAGGPEQPAGGLASSARLRAADLPATKLLLVASATLALQPQQDGECVGVAAAAVHVLGERPPGPPAAAATHSSSAMQGGGGSSSDEEEEGGPGEQQQQSQEGSERQQHDGDDSTMHCDDDDDDDQEWSEDDGGDAAMAPRVPPAQRAPLRGQRWSDSEEQEEEEDDEAVDEEQRGGAIDGVQASSEQLGDDADGDEEDEAPGDSRCGGSGSGATASGGQQDSLPGEELLLPLAFCRNCTGTLRPERWCALCGHHADDDEGLFDARPAHVQQRELLAARGLLAPPPSLTASAGLAHHCAAPQLPAAPAAAAAAASSSAGGGGGKVVLVYDERMEQHEEGASQPHPERPDRVRAVMARLLASGLASESCPFPPPARPPPASSPVFRRLTMLSPPCALRHTTHPQASASGWTAARPPSRSWSWCTRPSSWSLSRRWRQACHLRPRTRWAC